MTATDSELPDLVVATPPSRRAARLLSKLMQTILTLSALVGITAAAVALPAAVPRAPWTAGAEATSQDPNIRCAANPKTSVAIPFQRVHPALDPVSPPEEWHLRGPRMLVIVTDSTAWPAVWRAAVDSASTPSFAFGEGALIFLATKMYSNGPTSFHVMAIRQCRATGVVVVSTLETRPSAVATLGRSRGMDMVLLARGPLIARPVLFDQHMRYGWPPEL